MQRRRFSPDPGVPRVWGESKWFGSEPKGVVVNTAMNPLSMEFEECTRTDPPHFEHDPVMIGSLRFNIDTCDVDGNDDYCRVRRCGFASTMIVPVSFLGKPGVSIFEILNSNDRFLDALRG